MAVSREITIAAGSNCVDSTINLIANRVDASTPANVYKEEGKQLATFLYYSLPCGTFDHMMKSLLNKIISEYQGRSEENNVKATTLMVAYDIFVEKTKPAE